MIEIRYIDRAFVSHIFKTVSITYKDGNRKQYMLSEIDSYSVAYELIKHDENVYPTLVHYHDGMEDLSRLHNMMWVL